MARSRSIFEVDIYILLATVALVVIGILFIYSSGVTASGQVVSSEYLKQIGWAVSGFVLLGIVTFIDYRVLQRPSVAFFIAAIGALLFTLAFGKVVNGARRWIGIGPLGIQPSEFAKIALILVLARYFTTDPGRVKRLTGFAGGFAISLVPTSLVLMQPDLGTSLVYIPIFLFVAYAAGARLSHIGFLIGTGVLIILFTILPLWDQYIAENTHTFINVLRVVSAFRLLLGGLVIVMIISGIGWYLTRKRVFIWSVYVFSMVFFALPVSYIAQRALEEYQIMRLIVFLDPYVDPRGAGWNIIQSVTAVGSGGLFGKGYLMGTQSHYRYLPQQSTDFIFSILAEEWGYIGVIVVLILFMTIIGRGIYIMTSARDRFACSVSGGLVGLFSIHVLVNIGMAVGIMPITGLPLFLLSYGGSTLWTAMVAAGLLMSIYQHRYQY
ncbi:MAG: rod shape-determining protein RodA [Alkalispirochaeta sp.]